MSGAGRHRARPSLPTARKKLARHALNGTAGMVPRSARRPWSALELRLSLIRRFLW
jgi:hypothetical protein